MKKLFLFVAAASFTFFSSCDKEPEVPQKEKIEDLEKQVESKPFPIGAWRTSHQFFSRTVVSGWPSSWVEEMKESIDLVSDLDVSPEKSYQLTLLEDGTGSGSAPRRDNNGRFSFNLTWTISDDVLTLVETGPVFTGVFSEYEGGVRARVRWEIEQADNDGMVLLHEEMLHADAECGFFDETRIYRYTFEKE